MADSGAIRQARHKAHARGDHDLCDARRCHVLIAEARMAAGGDLAAGDLAAETRGLVEACNFPQDDPRRVMGALAVRLAEAIDRAGPARPPSVLVGEFRGLLRDMGDNPARRADGLDHVRLHRHQRRIAAHLHGVVPDA